MRVYGMLSLYTVMVCIPVISAFGELGHDIIGKNVFIHLSNASKSQIRECGYLHHFHDDMGRASSWADSFRFKHGFEWTAQYHYLDIADNPPENCTFIMPKSSVNLVSGLRKFLSKLIGSKCDVFAFLMLLHLAQDSHQPLHLTEEKKGGNEQEIYIDRHRMNLHHAWDTYFITKIGRDKIDSFIRYEMSLPRLPAEDYMQWIERISLLNCEIVWQFGALNYTDSAEKTLLELMSAAVLHTVQLMDSVLWNIN